MEIAQVLYDVQFTAYLRKTFIEDANNSMGKNVQGIINTGGNGGNGGGIGPVGINPQQ